MDPLPDSHRSTFINLRLAANLGLIVAAGFFGVWLWSSICMFPSIVWNDLRLAPTVALAQGWPVYPTGEQGVVNTWTYGPLPLFFFWPATWAPTAAAALMVAAVLNVALALVPLALVCHAWPAASRETGPRGGRLVAFLLCVALWPARHYTTLFADNLAIACGLVANLILVRARNPRAMWLSALVATAAVACKQIALGIPLAQVIWLGLTTGWREASHHALRCALAGAIIGGLAIAWFGAPGLWFVLWELPAAFPWVPNFQAVLPTLPEILLQLGLPAAVMVLGRQAFRQPPLLLPAVAWACAMPLGMMALFKTGGWLNSLHSLVLWFPPVIAALFASRLMDPLRPWLHLGGALAAAALACGRVLEAPYLPLRPQVAGHREARWLATRFHGQIWFPLHPLVTLYSDRHYYHDEDGLFVRKISHKEVTPAQVAAHLPPAMHVMALYAGSSDWGLARGMMPANARRISVGDWILWDCAGYQAP